MKWLLVTLVAGALAFAGCATSPQSTVASPSSSTSETVREGEGLWRATISATPIRGTLRLRQNSAGSTLEFSAPEKQVLASVGPRGWRMENPLENSSDSGGGAGPKKNIWLQFLHGLEGRKIAERWLVIKASPQFYALENAETGERLECHFPK